VPRLAFQIDEISVRVKINVGVTTSIYQFRRADTKVLSNCVILPPIAGDCSIK
jgi:hypothetical protein